MPLVLSLVSKPHVVLRRCVGCGFVVWGQLVEHWRVILPCMATGFIKQMPLSASKFALHELSLPTTIPSSVEPTHRAKIRLIIKPSCFHSRRPHFSPHLQHASIVAKPCKKAVRVLRSVRRKPLASAAHGSKQWKEVGTGGNNG